MIKVPRFEEINVKDVEALYKDDPQLQKYLPEVKAEGKFISRKFFFNILNTVYPDVVPRIIEVARAKRHKDDMEGEKRKVIEISEEWLDELKSVPFKSSK